MFDKKLKNFSAAALVLSCSLFSSLSYSAEVCFVNLSSYNIIALWQRSSGGQYVQGSDDPGPQILTSTANASCIILHDAATPLGFVAGEVSAYGMFIVQVDGQTAPWGTQAQVEVNEELVNGPPVNTMSAPPGDGSITVYNPISGNMDAYMGNVDVGETDYSSHAYFTGLRIGNVVRLLPLQEGSDGVYRFIFKDVPPPPPPAPIYQPDPDQPPGYIPSY